MRNQRRHRRYQHPEHQICHLELSTDDGAIDHWIGLIVDESHLGFSCVVVGPPAPPQVRFHHRENEKILTLLELKHQRQLADNIQLLGFARTDATVRLDAGS